MCLGSVYLGSVYLGSVCLGSVYLGSVCLGSVLVEQAVIEPMIFRLTGKKVIWGLKQNLQLTCINFKKLVFVV